MRSPLHYYDPELGHGRSRLSRWWFLWKEEVAIGTATTVVICLIITGVWFLFQNMQPSITEGTVQAHNFTAEYEETHDGGTTCISYNRDGTCSFRVQNPDIHHTHCIGGCFEIQVHGCTRNRQNEESCRNEWKTVSEFTYHDCERGSYWRRGHEGCPLR